MALRMRKYPRALRHTARFGIRRPIVEPPDPRRGDGCGTHRAGLQRDIKVMVHQPLNTSRSTGRANGQNFGMGRRIMQLACSVARLRHDMPGCIDYDSAHWHFSTCARGPRFGQCDMHERSKSHSRIWTARDTLSQAPQSS